MNDFDKRFKKHQDEFDRDFNRAKRFAVFAFLFNLVLVLAVGSFAVWVIIKFLQFWGVI